MADYPDWLYYPTSSTPPQWVHDLLRVVEDARDHIDTDVAERAERLTSDVVLAHLSSGLKGIGYVTEDGKRKDQRIHRPVLYGLRGIEAVAYDVDAVHDGFGILLEVEAGRGARGNAVFRDLIRTSLIVDATFFALGVAKHYRHQSGGRAVDVPSFQEARGTLDAIHASGRLRLPFKGVLLFGY